MATDYSYLLKIARLRQQEKPVRTAAGSLEEITANWPHPVPMAPVGVRLLGNSGKPLMSASLKKWNRRYKTVTDWCNAHPGEPIGRVISPPLSEDAIARQLEWLDAYIDNACRQARREGRTLSMFDEQIVVGVAKFRRQHYSLT